ncbi:MAG: hypothetical protein A2020_01260 [Lentisphaerae bacterium GWF2_45_14]|nr:MAG: hypothetical protein A2020_01260 [Lentisphaerae bacterium GWF2_45_14]
MAKKVKMPQKSEAEIPLSSMIDVVFLLLIYFIVTQKPIIEETLLGVNLPAPGQPQKNNSQENMLLKVDVMSLPVKGGDEIYHVNSRPWYFKDLVEMLIETGKNDKDTTIIINCGPNAKHKKLIRLLDACGEAGLSKLNIVNDPSVKFTPVKY